MHDYVYNKNGDSALDMFWIGVKNGAFIVMTVASTASTLKAKNVTRAGLKQALANAKKGFAKPYNTLKGWLYRDACQKSAQATQKAATLSEMQLKAAKNAPVMAGDLCLDEGMKAGRARGIDKVKRLRAAIELENANPCKANRMLKNQLVMEVQGDKQAMYILNTAGEGYDVVRAEFNGSLKKVYNQVDDVCKKEFQKKDPGKKIMIENASASSADDLVRGKKVTMDRDTTYYFMEGDKKIYLPQDEVVEIYNRNFYIENDIPAIDKVEYATVQKLKKLMAIIARQVPFIPKMDDLYSQLETSREQGLKLLDLLERGALLGQLKTRAKAVKQMSAPEKLFLDNPNLMYAFNTSPEIGTIRETFFYNQTCHTQKLNSPQKGDFLIDGKYSIEVGGADKSFNQIKDVPNSFLAIDDVEFGRGNKIPLWLFGFLY